MYSAMHGPGGPVLGGTSYCMTAQSIKRVRVVINFRVWSNVENESFPDDPVPNDVLCSSDTRGGGWSQLIEVCAYIEKNQD